MRLSAIILLALLFTACKQGAVKKDEKPIARVNDQYLYQSELNGVVAQGISGEDSATLVKNFIEKWVLNQVLLNKAEANLTEQEKNVESQIENYRSSLLIYTYQQKYLQQQLDTMVSEAEIEQYYRENQPNFVLQTPMMKGLFIKIPVKAPEIYRLRQWYRSDNDEDIKKLEGYCFKHAAIYDHFKEGWVNLNEVLRMIPGDDRSLMNTLQSRKSLEIRDGDFLYFINTKEIAPEGTVSPFELVKDDIHYIILNKRKVKLINELENSIYSDAQNRGNFTIY